MKTKKHLLTFVLSLCMVLSCFTGFHASETDVQAATDREEIYVTTITVDKGVVNCDYSTFWYDTPTPGMFLARYEFNKKCNPEMVLKGGGDERKVANTKNIKKGARKTSIVAKGCYAIDIGHWENEGTDAEVSCLSDKSVSGTVKVYFIPTCDTLSINTTELGLFEGQNSTLSVTAGPSKYAKNFGTTKWSSSKPDVVKVDKNGKITALKKGKATITAQVDSKKAKCVVTVYKKQESSDSIVATSMSLSKTTYSYDGKAKTPKVTVFDQNGEKLSSKYYTVSYSNNKNAGTATVSVQVNPTTVKDTTIEGAFLSQTFTIKPLKASKITLSKTSYNYIYKENGFRPKVTVYDSKGNKVSSKEYKVTYKNNHEGGTAKAIVQMNQNYGSKKFTKTFSINYDAKTNALLPETKVLYRFKDDKESADTLYFTKQQDSIMEKLLPYGDLDVCFDEIYNVVPYMNEKAFFPDNKNYGYNLTGKELRESYNTVNKGAPYDPKKFTGSISDYIQCVIHSPIVSVEGGAGQYAVSYRIICEDGSKYSVSYGSCAGMQYSAYSLFEIEAYYDEDDKRSAEGSYTEEIYSAGYYAAIIKVDKSKTPWGKK